MVGEGPVPSQGRQAVPGVPCDGVIVLRTMGGHRTLPYKYDAGRRQDKTRTSTRV